MKFEEKISGTKVTDFGEIKTIFDSQFVTLKEVQEKITRQKAMDFILDTLRFTKASAIEEGEDFYQWWATMDYDTIYKLSIIENYPKLEEELTEYFGLDWLKHYIRFNH